MPWYLSARDAAARVSKISPKRLQGADNEINYTTMMIIISSVPSDAIDLLSSSLFFLYFCLLAAFWIMFSLFIVDLKGNLWKENFRE